MPVPVPVPDPLPDQARMMPTKHQLLGIAATVTIHVALLSWSLPELPPPPEPPIPIVEIDLIDGDPTVVREHAPLAREAGDHADDEEAAAAAPAPEPGPPELAKKPELPATPTPPPPEPSANVAPAPAAASEPIPEDDANSEAAAIPAPAAEEPGGSADASTSPVREGTGLERGTGRGRGLRGPHDHSAYGAEIVRLVKAEIDLDPVPGIAPHDSIRVLLNVLPHGELAWVRDDRYGFAQVLGTSLDRRRTRKVLRRILRASNRFPAHPSTFPRGRYVVEVTVKFNEMG